MLLASPWDVYIVFSLVYDVILIFSGVAILYLGKGKPATDPRGERPSNINVIYRGLHAWKLLSVRNSSLADNAGLSSFV